MVVNIFYHCFELGYVEDLSVLVVFKSGYLVFIPSSDNDVKLSLDSVFLLSTLDEFVNILRVFVEFEVVEVTKAELGVHMVDSRAYNIIKTLPVPGFHAWIMQLLNKGNHDLHILDTVVKSLKCFVILNIFVLRKFRASKSLLKKFEVYFKVINVNLVPKVVFPGLNPTINARDEIPHILELDKLILAVYKLRLFKNLQFFSLLLHFAILDMVLVNLFIGCINHLRACLCLSCWHVC